MSFDYLTWETQWQRLYSGYHIRLKVIYSYSDHRLLIAVLYSKNSPHVQKFQCATALRSSSATNSDSGTLECSHCKNFPFIYYFLLLPIDSAKAWDWNCKDEITFPWPSAPGGEHRSLAPLLLPTFFLSSFRTAALSILSIPPSFACPFLLILTPACYKSALDGALRPLWRLYWVAVLLLAGICLLFD